MSESTSVVAAKTRTMIESKWGDIQKCLPKHVTAERFLRVIQNALGKNPKLLECTPISLMSAITISSELGLEVNTPLGLAYILPYEQSRKDGSGRWVKELQAQFQIGYKGLIELAYRSGKVRSIAAECVYKNDTFSRTLGIHRDLQHIPATDDRGEIIGYYATVIVEGADPHFEYITVKEAHAHGEKYSKAYQYDLKQDKRSSPWSTNFDAMAMKTVVLKALKLCPKAIEDPALRAAMNHNEDSVIDTTATALPSTETPQFDLAQLEATPEQPAGFEKATADTSPQPIDVKAEATDDSDLVLAGKRDEIIALQSQNGIPATHMKSIVQGVRKGAMLTDLNLDELATVLAAVKEAA